MPIFRTKARAVDLLGKGQIADLPTAISEVWKNGYDAYADDLSAYLYQEGYEGLNNPIFVIADDGTGMSYDDILEKWIVLGTDSKSRSLPDKKGPDTLWKRPRIKMGEKGIGRLSVAYLGNPMLMLTKKINEPLQSLFFDWRILENYDFFLEDINIPLKPVLDIDNFNHIFDELRNELLNNISKNKKLSGKNVSQWKDQLELYEEIINSISRCQLPSFFKREILNKYEKNENHGTLFVVFNPDDQLLYLSKYFDKSQEDRPTYITNAINEIRISLNGIFNVFRNNEEVDNNKINTSLLIKSIEGDYDVVSSRDFFNSDDFKKCDHLISGAFDEEGKFSGRVRVFKKTVNYTFRANRPRGNTSYGPFEIKVGYVVGRGEPTIMKLAEYRILSDKVDMFGGLYIYRDNFRVLPYGRTEYDFLNLEKKRSKQAGEYFFSHRRMFGYIDISRKRNSNLKDKAGREGFINNRGYREFKSDLEAFFIDLAKKYFGTDAESDLKFKQQEELKKQREVEKNEKSREKEERKNFIEKLEENSKELLEVEKKLKDLTKKLNILISKSSVIYDEIQSVLLKIEEYKIDANSLILNKPKRFTLTENQEKKLFDYNKKFDLFLKTSYKSANLVISKAREKLKEQELLKEYNNKVDYYKNIIFKKFQVFREELIQSWNEITNKLENEEKSFQTAFINNYNNNIPNELTKVNINHSIRQLENYFDVIINEINNRIPPLITYLNRISFDIDEDMLTGYYKLRFEEIERQWQQTKELAQLGIAVEIIDHQFNALYSRLAYTISSFDKNIKDDNKSLRSYNSLKIAFEHLESKYKLLSPLYRTTGKTRKNVTGQFIYDYLNSFFENQFKDKEIDFRSTVNFNEYSIYTYESIIMSVFINVIHNAIYWLTPVKDRKIILDFVQDEILIMNSGELIEDFYLFKIFELFYSRRPNGRGIGLYLAKENLNSVGLDIFASNDQKHNRLKGACFIIKKLEEKENE